MHNTGCIANTELHLLTVSHNVHASCNASVLIPMKTFIVLLCERCF